VEGRPELRDDPQDPDPTGDVGEDQSHVRTFEKSVRRNVARKSTGVVISKKKSVSTLIVLFKSSNISIGDLFEISRNLRLGPLKNFWK
jgi:hypothetical protein